jgi:hypothetical protein
MMPGFLVRVTGRACLLASHVCYSDCFVDVELHGAGGITFMQVIWNVQCVMRYT